MANGQITEVVSKEAYSQIEKLLNGLDDITNRVNKINANSRSATLPSQFAGNNKNIAQEFANIDKAREKSIATIEKQRLAELKLQQSREKAFDSYQLKLTKQQQAEAIAAQKAIQDSERQIKQKEKEFAKFERDFNKYEAQLKKKEIEEAKAAVSAQRSAEKQRLAEIKLQQAREKAFDDYEKRLERENAKLNAATSLYNKIQQKLNGLNAEHRDLAAKKQLGINLTDAEAKRYDFLGARITKYDTALKGVDASMGKYQRNVGNYASAFNPLSNSINQLTREMPAFANSVQTGFMAISNNLPIFFDSIQQIIVQNKELQAQGKPTQSVLKQIAGAVFSLGTALSVGVTLLTIYGKEIVEWAGSLLEGKKAMDASVESAKSLNTIRQESLKSIVQEKIQLQANLETAKDTTLSYKERKIAADKVLQQYPFWFEGLGREAILNGKVETAVRGVNAALLARAKAQAATTKITENQGRVIDLEEELRLEKQVLKQAEQRAKREAEIALQRIGGTTRESADLYYTSKSRAASDALATSKTRVAEIQEEINFLNATNNRLTGYTLEQTKAAIGLDAEATTQKKVKADEFVQAETNSRVAFERSISVLEERLSLMSKENSMYPFLATQLKIVKDAYEAMYGEQEKVNEETEKTIKYGTVDYYSDLINRLKEEQSAVATSTREYQLYGVAIQEAQDKLDALTGKQSDFLVKLKEQSKAMSDYLQTFVNDFAQQTGFNTLFKVLQNDIEGFGRSFKAEFEQLEKLKRDGNISDEEYAEATKELNKMRLQSFATTFSAIAEITQEVFNFISQNQRAQTEAALSELDMQQRVVERYAQTEEAKQQIQDQYDEKRREIRRREAQQEKQNAIFNAIINTAQGVTAAYAKGNIPLSVIIGALGAAQIALIASRQIPEFKDGVRGFGGGLAVVGDGGRSEIVRTPSGELWRTPNKDTLVNLPKGSDVFKSEMDFIRNSGTLLGGMPHVIGDMRSGASASEMREIMREAMAGSATYVSNFDKRGFTGYVVTAGGKSISHNNKMSFKAKTFKN